MSAATVLAPEQLATAPGALPVRLRTPQWDPPYDDERPAALTVAPAWCDPLPLHVTLPGVLTREQAQPPVRAPVRSGLPDARTRAITMVRALVEVMAGDRPASHLARYATLEVQRVLAELVPPTTARTRPWGRTVRSIHVAEPTPAVVEVTAVVNRGARCAAVALRLEARAGAWVMSALEVG